MPETSVRLRPKSVFGITRTPRSAYSEISVRFPPKCTVGPARHHDNFHNASQLGAWWSRADGYRLGHPCGSASSARCWWRARAANSAEDSGDELQEDSGEEVARSE